MSSRFAAGRLLITPGALQALGGDGEGHESAAFLLSRHMQGDWGDLDADDCRANDRAVTNGTRIFSAYDRGGQRFWVITEADRSATTILLPTEY